MSIHDKFPVFEADQVLTNDHLNCLFNYLDQQSRLTRIKLIGSGIVCGLDIKYSANSIHVSKGCGLTSQGYMIMLCDTEYTHYISYTAPVYPNDLQLISQCSDNREVNGAGFLFYGNYRKSVFLLRTQAEYDNLNADEKATAIALSQTTFKFLDTYAVVLFLDIEEEDLKNCDTNDCNDKGSRMNIEVKALLVDKSLLATRASDSTDSSLLHHVELRRYNVPVQDIKSADDVLNAFYKLVDNSDTALTRLSNDLIYCWTHYNYLLKDESTNPFTNVLVELKTTRDNIIKKYPILIQYFYDFIDDLIKSFYEFKHKVFDVLGECCGDELQFPFHIMLGEATANTSIDERSAYRQYFIYSPLFDSQDDKLNEVRSLFTRMKLMVHEFVLNNSNEAEKKEFINFDNAQVKITPSQYGRSFLSDRSIPYYYKVNETGNELYRFWNFDKTRRGSSRFILSYNAIDYNTADTIVHPLNYDIEWFNFFRIEGHIGKPVLDALTTVKELQQNYNLPFDVIALSADYIGAILKGKDPKCVIQDLESDYRVLIAGFICRLHNAFCNVGHLKYIQNQNYLFLKPLVSAIGDAALNRNATVDTGQDNTIDKSDLLLFNINHPYIATMVEQFHAIKNYVKGDTLKDLCNPLKDTIGDYYLTHIIADHFTNPVTYATKNSHFELYHELFDFIDRVETLLATLMNNELADLDVNDVKIQYEKINEVINSIHRIINELSASFYSIFSNSQLNFFENLLLNLFVKNIQLLNQSCFIEQLVALKNEYSRRLAQYRMAQNFNYYFKQHGGMEHKAGVPKSGTFILVYHEERNNRHIDIRSLFVNQELSTLMLTRFQTLLKPTIEVDEMEFNTKLMQVATLYRDPELYLRFKDVMTKYLADCKDLPIARRKKIKDLIDAPPPKRSFVLEDGMVIADFYVPYLCCSDCPPVAYILPEKPIEEKVIFDIQPRTYLFDDANNYPFSTDPPVTKLNTEQKPFVSPDLVYDKRLKIWTDEKNVLYLHPAMEIEETLKTTVTYKSISLDLTIIKPDAAFTIQRIQDLESVDIIQLRMEAVNKDAKEYIWNVGEEENVFNSPGPHDLPINLEKSETKIELIISYEINGIISDDSKEITFKKAQIKKMAKEPIHKIIKIVK